MNYPHNPALLVLMSAILCAGWIGSPQTRGADSSTATVPERALQSIQELNLVHFSHTDVGFTDHPSVCRELYRRYLDIAIDAVLDSRKRPVGERFYWTAEATFPVHDWWQAAPPSRRRQFLQAVRTGQLEIAALPFNNTPFMDAAQWQTALHWLPEDLWDRVRPKVAVQNDVNGTPRAAALALLDRGIRYLFTGINEDSGGVPFPRPAAFWWKMPDGRRMFVWLNIGYGSGFDFFEPAEWRRGPVPFAADTRYRPPRAGDILRTDEASLRAAHRLCVDRLRALEKSGYSHSLLTISITSQWRFDNDPPFPGLADFVAAWNKLGLKPRLRLTTVSDAMERMEKAMGPTAPEHTGEWTDWWANGTASAPREVAASRAAKRDLSAAASLLWGPLTPAARLTMDGLYRELCLFDEHTWGSSLSVAKPYSLDTQGQFNEKAGLAFRPMARAQWLLSQRARSRLISEGEGLFLANPGSAAFTGWISLIATCLRGPYQSIEDPRSGERMKLYFEPGIEPWGRPAKPEDLTREDISATFPDNAPNKIARFWVERLDPNTIRRLRLSPQALDSETPPSDSQPVLRLDDQGWPIGVRWPGMTQPLFIEGFGDFVAVQVQAFAPRWSLRPDKLEETAATVESRAAVRETPHTLAISQAISHPRLQWGTRIIEIWKREPRVRFTLRINRLSSAAPEIFYVVFPFPTGSALPQLSCGGIPFTPFTDQLFGTCRDYFAIDGWAEYITPQGRWLWVSRDAPLMTMGSKPTLSRRQTPPRDPGRLLAMIFNNFWYTNFAADEHGIMEFQFDVIWRNDANTPTADLANSLLIEPTVLINPALPEDPRVVQHLFRP
ncbi:MAG TPA: hypothetical protein P5186_14930 [Candidatus Paceibacterota bacterium]|nr:hypothetical protein [Verrucomicrobiota bacterium]HRY49341.1 hypothetical protein [Candidatus Paceibacterota bacterium]